MLFNSWKFMVFFPVVTAVYFRLSYEKRQVWLLMASCFFYMCWKPQYILLIGASTVITYLSGILIEQKPGRKRQWVALCFVLNLGILVFFKYFHFLFRSVSALLSVLHIDIQSPAWNFLLPVGISFYTFQALSYTMDVYRGDIRAEKRFLKYALYVSFFPQLVAGPIERSGHLLGELDKRCEFSWDRFRDGLLLMLWGFFEKVVIADRISILVNTVYGDYMSYGGFKMAVATILFAFQVYCDFAGYSDIAVGTARILGIDLMQNFRQPYFSKSIAEFWRRWHISLSTWFRDYLYIPLGGSRRGRLVRYRNVMIVFLVSGLWHGASWNYVLWGGIHGFYQVFGNLTKPWRQGMIEKYHIRTDCFSWRALQTVITFFLVDFAWLFFRAPGAMAAFRIIRNSVRHCNPFQLLNGGLYSMGLSRANMKLLLMSLIILAVVDFLRGKGELRQKFLSQNKWFYYGITYGGLLCILFFGIYGEGYHPGQFLYFQF